MACLEMYNQNSEHHMKGINNNNNNNPPPMSPSRISFSNDFLESQSQSQSRMMIRPNQASAYRDAPVSSDFEFSVSNHSMMSADELFFKGRLLPFKENKTSSTTTTTLRDELLLHNHEENDGQDFSLRPPKNPTRWKGFLGLKKSHLIGSKIKSCDKSSQGSAEKRLSLHEDHQQCAKNSQDSDE